MSKTITFRQKLFDNKGWDRWHPAVLDPTEIIDFTREEKLVRIQIKGREQKEAYHESLIDIPLDELCEKLRHAIAMNAEEVADE